VVKAAKKTADLALKYYFEMLGLPLTASENEVRAAYSYLSTEQAPSKYVAGSAEQKRAEEKQAELKFAHDKLTKWFQENPDANLSQAENFHFAGTASQWKKKQADEWAAQLKEFRAKESEVWKEIQNKRKKARFQAFMKRTKIMAAIICALSFAGQSWHDSWEGRFRQIQSQNLFEETAGRFITTRDPQGLHDQEIQKAYALKNEWDADEKDSKMAVYWTIFFSLIVGAWWLPPEAKKEIVDAIRNAMKKAKQPKKAA
jgi:hypothetical protein